MVKPDNSIHFIDYQGGMKGAPQYDVASALWQARANLNDEWKEKLLNDYINELEKIIDSKNENKDKEQLSYFEKQVLKELKGIKKASKNILKTIKKINV